jgi:hypothetical protein
MKKKLNGGLVKISIFSTLGKIIFFPVYAPYKLAKKEAEKRKPFPIVSAVQTTSPEAFKYYFEGQGYKTSVVPAGNEFAVLVWDKTIKEKERTEILTKLSQVI